MDVIYNLNESQIDGLHSMYQNEWWTKGRTLLETKQCVEGSQVCIGIVDEEGNLNAFARVLSDFTFKALLFDVIVSSKYREKGLGEKLVHLIRSHPKLSRVKSFELYCLPSLMPFYEKFGFSSDVAGIGLMRLEN